MREIRRPTRVVGVFAAAQRDLIDRQRKEPEADLCVRLTVRCQPRNFVWGVSARFVINTATLSATGFWISSLGRVEKIASANSGPRRRSRAISS